MEGPELEPPEELEDELLEDEELPPETVNTAALLVEETGALLATKLVL